MRRSLTAGMVICLFLASGLVLARGIYKDVHPTLPIGSKAPAFNLPAVDGKSYSLASFASARILVVIFTCNHCPTAQAYEDRIMKLVNDYAHKDVAVVAIMPNDPKSLRLDEMDFSDLSDSFEDMKQRAKDKQFNFPYLYDGDTESASKAYGPVATPHVFIFDQERRLRYNGRFDDTEKPDRIPRTNDARNAIDALLQNRDVPVQTTKVFGCSVKWAEKRDLVQKSLDAWAKEPVLMDTIGIAGIKLLLQNTSNKLWLINIWATANPVSVDEFQEFIKINRMYRDRDFELITISADNPADQAKVHSFLKMQQASCKNILFHTDSKAKLIEAIDPAWEGNLPYTMLVEPGGNIVYRKQGSILPLELKKTIVNNHLIGKYP